LIDYSGSLHQAGALLRQLNCFKNGFKIVFLHNWRSKIEKCKNKVKTTAQQLHNNSTTTLFCPAQHKLYFGKHHNRFIILLHTCSVINLQPPSVHRRRAIRRKLVLKILRL
jgi:hypothetical protein